MADEYLPLGTAYAGAHTGLFVIGQRSVRFGIGLERPDGDAGAAQWWCPELILLGNTDVQLHADGPIAWKRQDGNWKYEHLNPDGKLYVALKVEQIELGWRAALTIGNRTDQAWPTVVCPICLLLRASPAFADKDLVLAMTYGVVIFSIVVQGLTVGGLARRVVA